MTQAPPQCIFCGAGNTPYEDDGEIGPFIDTERDTGWGDPIYVCMRASCAGQIAVLAGYVAPDESKALRNELKSLRRELHDANAKLETKERRDRGARARERVGT